jgi:hypothetical protein
MCGGARPSAPAVRAAERGPKEVAAVNPRTDNGLAMNPKRVAPRRALLLCGAASILIVYALVVVLPAARRPDTEGFAAYYTVSRVVLERSADVWRAYDDAWFQSRIDAYGFHHVLDAFLTQPPTMSLILLPLAWMAPAGARATWIALSVACWVLGVGLMCRTVVPRTGTRWTVLGCLAATAAYLPLRENLDRGQSYALLFLLLTCCIALLARETGRTLWMAGVPLGAMLVLKSAGGWLLVMLFFSRRWRTVGGAAATYASVALLTLPLLGGAAWGLFFERLRLLPSDPIRYVSAYQTVSGLFGHLFVFDAVCNPAPIVAAPLLATAGTLAVTVLAAAQSIRFGRGADDAAARVLRLAVFGSLVVTMAPIAEGYHYLLVLPAVIIAVAWAFSTRPPLASVALLGASLLLLTAPQTFYSHPRLQAGALALLAYPRVYGAFLLWGWLGHALSRHAEAPRATA